MFQAIRNQAISLLLTIASGHCNLMSGDPISKYVAGSKVPAGRKQLGTNRSICIVCIQPFNNRFTLVIRK